MDSLFFMEEQFKLNKPLSGVTEKQRAYNRANYLARKERMLAAKSDTKTKNDTKTKSETKTMSETKTKSEKTTKSDTKKTVAKITSPISTPLELDISFLPYVAVNLMQEVRLTKRKVMFSGNKLASVYVNVKEQNDPKFFYYVDIKNEGKDLIIRTTQPVSSPQPVSTYSMSPQSVSNKTPALPFKKRSLPVFI